MSGIKIQPFELLGPIKKQPPLHLAVLVTLLIGPLWMPCPVMHYTLKLAHVNGHYMHTLTLKPWTMLWVIFRSKLLMTSERCLSLLYLKILLVIFENVRIWEWFKNRIVSMSTFTVKEYNYYELKGWVFFDYLLLWYYIF